jgi:Protein of unknown function (DUF3037)
VTSYYSVIQYITDPAVDERVNIAVVAFDDETNEWRIESLRDWRRAERFTGQPARGLKLHLADIQSELTSAKRPRDLIESMAQSDYSVRATEPRASLRSLDEATSSAARRMLGTGPVVVHRVKAALLQKTRIGFEFALQDLGLGVVADRVLVKRSEIAGVVDSHPVDFGLVNGHLLLGARALTFPARQSTYVKNEISATAWSAQDIGAADGPRFAVLVAPPEDQDRSDYQRAMSVLGELGTEVVQEGAIPAFAKSTVSTYQEELASVAKSLRPKILA